MRRAGGDSAASYHAHVLDVRGLSRVAKYPTSAEVTWTRRPKVLWGFDVGDPLCTTLAFETRSVHSSSCSRAYSMILSYPCTASNSSSSVSASWSLCATRMLPGPYRYRFCPSTTMSRLGMSVP